MTTTLSARNARSEDYPCFARLFLELEVNEPVPSPEVYEREILPHIILLEDSGAPVAYAYFRPIGALGRVTHVVVDPGARGRGVGQALMKEMATRLRGAGCVRWMLNVKPDNVPAIRLYQRFGMQSVMESCALRFAWRDLPRLPETAGDLRGRTIASDGSEDAAVEGAFRMVPGALADGRARGRRLLRLEDPSAPHDLTLGAAIFDRDFGGAHPFRLRSPDLARPFLEALHGLGRPDHERVTLFVEGDPPLAARLIEAGAAVHLRALRMEGPIPGA